MRQPIDNDSFPMTAKHFEFQLVTIFDLQNVLSGIDLFEKLLWLNVDLFFKNLSGPLSFFVS